MCDKRGVNAVRSVVLLPCAGSGHRCNLVYVSYLSHLSTRQRIDLKIALMNACKVEIFITM